MNAELLELGLSSFFVAQLSLEEIDRAQLARVLQVQRSQLLLDDGQQQWSFTPANAWYQMPSEQRPTVGDWLVLNRDSGTLERLLDRKSVLKRVAPDAKTDVQLMAANIDTLFIVTSCNDDFNESRLERYLSLALDAGVDPVIVLTKADLSNDAESYRQRAQSLGSQLAIELVNALETSSLDNIRHWITPGSTIALAGSSGVGKSTLVNSLAGEVITTTGAIREQDAKGRHTTTYRALHRLPSGGILLDLPGIRELKISDLDGGLNQVFDDVDALAKQCRFNNCQHHDEPGCAVQQAIRTNTLDERRLRNYEKLAREDARLSATLAEQRQKDKLFGKKVKRHMQDKRNR